MEKAGKKKKIIFGLIVLLVALLGFFGVGFELSRDLLAKRLTAQRALALARELEQTA